MEQDHVVTRGQLAERGLTHEHVASRTANGLWVQLGPRVLALQSGLLTAAQRRWVGVLHAGEGSALCGLTAAEAAGFRGFETPTVHVAVRHGREVGDLAHRLVDVRIHQTRNPGEHLSTGRRPAHHLPARAVVDAASDARYDNRTRALIAAAVQQGLVRPEDLLAYVERRRTLPKRALIRATILEVAGGAHSLPELQYARALRAAGLPLPTRQQRVRRPNGSWYLDNDFEPFLVTVEVNGAQHDSLLAREYDDERRGSLQVGGRLVVDLSSYTVRRRPRVAALRTAEALVARGYVPSPSVTARLLAYAQAERWTSTTMKWTG